MYGALYKMLTALRLGIVAVLTGSHLQNNIDIFLIFLILHIGISAKSTTQKHFSFICQRYLVKWLSYVYITSNSPRLIFLRIMFLF